MSLINDHSFKVSVWLLVFFFVLSFLSFPSPNLAPFYSYSLLEVLLLYLPMLDQRIWRCIFFCWSQYHHYYSSSLIMDVIIVKLSWIWQIVKKKWMNVHLPILTGMQQTQINHFIVSLACLTINIVGLLSISESVCFIASISFHR